MLIRLADNGYWMGRYLTRADHVAHVVAATQDLAMDPEPGPAAFTAACAATGSGAAVDGCDGATWLVCGPGNPSSLVSCLRAARENARAARPVIGDDLWECANAAWLHVQPLDAELLVERGVADTCSWAVGEVRRMQGTIDDLLQDEVAAVIRLGCAFERIDAICRLLAAVLTEGEVTPHAAPATPAFRRWRALAESACVVHHLRRLGVSAGDLRGTCRVIVAERSCPRSLASAFADLQSVLATLGAREAQRLVAGWDIPQHAPGPQLHAALMRVVALANEVSAQIHATDFSLGEAPGSGQSQSQNQNQSQSQSQNTPPTAEPRS